MLYLTPDGEDVSVLGAECKRGGKPRPDGLVRRLQANRRPEIRVGRFARLLGGEAIGVVDRYASAAPASASARHRLFVASCVLRSPRPSRGADRRGVENSGRTACAAVSTVSGVAGGGPRGTQAYVELG